MENFPFPNILKIKFNQGKLILNVEGIKGDIKSEDEHQDFKTSVHADYPAKIALFDKKVGYIYLSTDVSETLKRQGHWEKNSFIPDSGFNKIIDLIK